MTHTYTHTRIRKDYLEKLQVVAAHPQNKRSSTKQLEVMIDAALAVLPKSAKPVTKRQENAGE